MAHHQVLADALARIERVLTKAGSMDNEETNTANSFLLLFSFYFWFHLLALKRKKNIREAIVSLIKDKTQSNSSNNESNKSDLNIELQCYELLFSKRAKYYLKAFSEYFKVSEKSIKKWIALYLTEHQVFMLKYLNDNNYTASIQYITEEIFYAKIASHSILREFRQYLKDINIYQSDNSYAKSNITTTITNSVAYTNQDVRSRIRIGYIIMTILFLLALFLYLMKG